MISIDFLSRTPGDEVPDCSDPTGMGGRVWKGWGSKRLPEGEEGSPGGEEGGLWSRRAGGARFKSQPLEEPENLDS